MSDFLNEFLSSNKPKRNPEAKYAVDGNKWDRHTRERIAANVKEFLAAANRLGEQVDTGYEAMNDSLLALFKASPKLKDQKEVRPSFLINHSVMSEMMKLREYEQARHSSVGDAVATGLAAATMEPELEVIFDKLKQAQDMAKSLEEKLAEAEDYADRIDELLQNASDEDPEEYESNLEQLQEALDDLREQIAQEALNLSDEIDGHRSDIQSSLRTSLDKVNEQNDDLNKFEHWSLSPGSVARMDSTARLRLAEKLKTPQFKRMAEIIGRMQNMALSEQVNSVNYANDEVYQLTRGNDISRLVPTELMAFDDDVLIYDWLHRYTERSLVQYDLRGEETVNRGGIVLLIDSSSSMRGERSVWAKGIGLALLRIAKQQRRPFNVVEFSSPGLFGKLDFDTTSDVIKLDVTYSNGVKQSFRGADAVIEFAEFGLYGGTCFHTPFSLALDMLKDQHVKQGSVNGDIVFLTDGHADLNQRFIYRFKKEQERLGFKVYGIAIGGEARKEPMNQMCDGNVITLRRLVDVNDVRPLFSGVVSK